jgi:hypothetical protein
MVRALAHRLRDGTHQVFLMRAHHRDADLHLGHAGGVQRLRDGQLLVVAEGHAGGLLTVTQRGVVDGQAADGGGGHRLPSTAVPVGGLRPFIASAVPPCGCCSSA